MVISHVKLSLLLDCCEIGKYIQYSMTFVVENILPLYNKQKNTWMPGNTKFISRVENDISRVSAAHS